MWRFDDKTNVTYVSRAGTAELIRPHTLTQGVTMQAAAAQRRKHLHHRNLHLGRSIVPVAMRRAQAMQPHSDSLEAPDQMSAVERRRHPRRSGVCTVSIVEPASNFSSKPNLDWAFRAARLRGRMLDVSLKGTAFLLSEPIEAGRHLLLQLNHSQRGAAVSRRITVAGCCPEGDGQWRILCEFQNQLSFEELTQLSSEPTAGSRSR